MDQARLRGKILEVYKTQEAFARAMSKAGTKMSLCTLNKRLNGHSEWGADEIRRACELLGIKSEDIPLYFFTPKVGK